MRLTRVPGARPVTAHDVFAFRDGAKVIRVNASWHVADVINLQAFGDGADELFMGDTVCLPRTATVSP